MARKFIISVPVADLREKPQELFPKNYSYNELRLSQLLLGERCTLITQQESWLKIYALEQPRHTEKGWQPYAGWIHQSEAIEVKQFEPLVAQSFGRSQLVEEAKLFLGIPYLWGGRSKPLKNSISGVDCSGLINLLYRAQGIVIPRDAHDQYLKSRQIPHLQPGDLIYLSKKKRITHVLLKLEKNTFIESPETGKNVHLQQIDEKLIEKKGKWHFKCRLYNAYLRTLDGASYQ